MPLKYYCPKCDKRFVDWGAEKLGFKCPDCAGETLYRVGTQPEGDGAAPSLSKSAAKRKVKPRAKVAADDNEYGDELVGAVAVSDDDDDSLDSDVSLDDDDSDVMSDSLAIDDE